VTDRRAATRATVEVGLDDRALRAVERVVDERRELSLVGA
jgi:hypothetical protein